MKSKDISNITSDSELKLKLSAIDLRWIRIMSIKDGRRRSREILRLSQEVKSALYSHKRRRQTANKIGNNEAFLLKVIKSLKKLLLKIGSQSG